MSFNYDKSIATDFSGTFVADEFHETIEEDATIGTNFSHIDTNGDTVSIWFTVALDAAGQTQLDSLVSSYTPRVYNTSKYFDAIVDSKYTGDYTSIAAAFAAGNTSVYVRDGMYIETQDINIPDGGQIYGESQGNVQIILAAGNSIKVDGSGGVKEDTGTVSVVNGSNTVTGSGTTFTNLSAEQFILLGTNFYKIISIESDTSLKLEDTYQGNNLTGMNLLAQAMYTGIKITNIIIYGSASYGLFCRGMRHSSLKGVAILGCSPNMYIQDSGDFSIYEFICGSSNGVGLTLDNCYSILNDTLDIYNSSSHGIELKTYNVSNIFDSCSSSNNGGHGLCLLDTVKDLNITENVIKSNVGKGIYSATTASQIIVNGCTVISNGGVGVDLEGTSNIISNNIIEYNGKCGIEGGNDCTISSNQIKGNTEDGIHYNIGIDHGTITGNRITDNGFNGINMLANGAVVTGNCIRNNTLDGIAVNGSNNNVSSNNISGCANGITISATSVETIVSNNQIINNTTDGINVASGATDTMCTFNIFKGNTNANITDAGTATVDNGNIKK